MTADCAIYREQLAATYPRLGHAIWEPTSVDIGDVGCIRDGKFICLFNALRPEDHPSNLRFGVPEAHDPLVPKVANHIDKGILKQSHYCSSRIIVTSEPEVLAKGPDDEPEVTFSNTSRRGGAVLSLPVDASRQDTLARRDFGQWMIKHIDYWLAFTRQLGLGIEQMEDIILVTGCHRTISWANVAFLEGHTNAQASFGVEVVRGLAVSVKWQFFPARVRGAMCSWGPEGKNLPEDQCIFIRGFRVFRRLGILPRQLRGAAGPNPSSGRDHDDDEQHVELVSLPNATVSHDPLHVLSEYIINQSPYCDMSLVHDDDLARIHETWDNGLGSLHPDAIMLHLEISKPEIVQHVVDCQPSASASRTEVGTKSNTVAMFSNEFQEWNSLSTRKSDRDSTWRTDIRSAALAIAMSLVWASCFQSFVLALSQALLKFNSKSPNHLPNPHFYLTAVCGATQLTIADQRPTAGATLALGSKLLLSSALLLHVQNKVVASMILAWTLNPLTMLKVVGQRGYRQMFPIILAAILVSTTHVSVVESFYATGIPIVWMFFGNAVAGIAGSLSHAISSYIDAEMISDACHKPAFTALRFGPELKINLVLIFMVITGLSCLSVVMQTLGDVGWSPPDLGDIMYLSVMTTTIVMVYMTWILEQHLLRPIRYAPRQLRRFYAQAIARIARWVGIGHNENKTEYSLGDGTRSDSGLTPTIASNRRLSAPPHTSSDAKT